MADEKVEPRKTNMPIDVGNLEQYGLFDLFWNTHGDRDLAGGGLYEVTREGAEKLHEYARMHELGGERSQDGFERVDNDERSVVKALLEHPDYGAFFELDGKIRVMDLFGLRPEELHPPDGDRPDDHGELVLPERVSLLPPNRLANVDPHRLPELMRREYSEQRALFEASDIPAETRAANTLGLLRDYASALWSHKEQPYTEEIGHDLLDAFEGMKYAQVLGAKSFNGAPFGAAQSLVLGLDPNQFETSFSGVRSDVLVTHLSMDGGLAGPMAEVDRYLAATSKPTGAAAFEEASPLGWMIGEPSGHKKRGNLSEREPMSTSGLNFGLALFPRDDEIRSAQPKPGFDFPIDCLDAFGNILTLDPRAGERLIVTDKEGVRLSARKIIETNEQGEKIWHAEFLRPDGSLVAPADVIGRFEDARGRLKGDGRATGQLNMWWWGFCDRNTAQGLYKAKFDIPELDLDPVRVRAGSSTLDLRGQDAQRLINADIPDIATGSTFSGFRFNNEPQQIVLKDGRRLLGRVAAEVVDSAPIRQRMSADVIALRNDDQRPLLGSVDIEIDGRVESIPAGHIVSMEKDLTTGIVTVHLDNGWRDTVTGTLKSEIPWDRAESRDGRLVLAQTEDKPIRGEIRVETARGTTERIKATEVASIVGEMQRDMRLSQWMVWVSQQQGMYASDSALSEVVSNGMRWVNRLDQDVRSVDDGDRPDWAPRGRLIGIHGPLDPAPDGGDSVVWVRGAYAYAPGEEPRGTAWAGWLHINRNGRILNEGFTTGENDFGWSATGPLDWTAKSTFNPFMDPELRLALLVNGVRDLKEDTASTQDLAERLNLPKDWKDLRSAV